MFPRIMSKTSSMKTTTDTLDRLRTHGKMGDSLDNVVNRVLDKIEDLTDRVEDVEADIDEIEGEDEDD